MSIYELFGKIFSSKATQLTWARVSDVDRNLGTDITEAGEGYYSVRVAQMYVQTARILWKKYLPMVNGLVKQGAIETSSVVGAAQIKQFGDIAVDNMIVLNQPLTGPIVYTGEEFSVVVGLLSVMSRDYGQALLDTAASLSDLVMLDAGAALKVAPVLKSTIENLLGAKDVRLEVGIMNSFSNPGNRLTPGLHVGIAAPSSDINVKNLRYFDNRLQYGPDRRSSKPFDTHDYMVLLIEGRTHRPDWASLPELAGFEEKFSKALAAGDHSARLAAIKPAFQEFLNAVNASTNLAKPDKKALPAQVNNNLQHRLDQLNTGGFELKSADARAVDPTRFDFLDIEPLPP
jgi:hypothetical protein